VALARALARKPAVLLLDEPFSAVDRATREKLHAEIIALRAHLNMPVVLVTHDMNEAQLLADRMLVIDKGRLVREGTTAQVMADSTALRAMGIREVAALLPAVIVATEEDGLTRLDTATGPIFLPGVQGLPGTRLRVRIMAHEVILSRARPVGAFGAEHPARPRDRASAGRRTCGDGASGSGRDGNPRPHHPARGGRHGACAGGCSPCRAEGHVGCA
jgi:molybdate transport system ATP-binding protein